jgi:hypothetical protein
VIVGGLLVSGGLLLMHSSGDTYTCGQPVWHDLVMPLHRPAGDGFDQDAQCDTDARVLGTAAGVIALGSIGMGVWLHRRSPSSLIPTSS